VECAAPLCARRRHYAGEPQLLSLNTKLSHPDLLQKISDSEQVIVAMDCGPVHVGAMLLGHYQRQCCQDRGSNQQALIASLLPGSLLVLCAYLLEVNIWCLSQAVIAPLCSQNTVAGLRNGTP